MSGSRRYTIAQLAAALFVPVDVARGLVRFLVEKDMIQPVDVEKRPDGKGQPAKVYLFDSDLCARLAVVLAPIWGSSS